MGNKLKLGYDNHEDAKTKLVGTYCLYKGKAIVIQSVHLADPEGMKDDGKYIIYAKDMVAGGPIKFMMDDPEFNCSNYNIGYYNSHHAAVWFYRLPLKQYKQGLRHDQVGAKASSKGYLGLGLKQGRALAEMLENQYPSLQKSAMLLREQEASIMAFHRNFAMTWDRVHRDFILEYKGDQIGHSKNLEDFTLMPEYEHLKEALKEAAGQ